MNPSQHYTGPRLAQVAFPLGGIGAGSLCLTGAGGFNHVALRHQPAMHHEPMMFAAVGFPDVPADARILEGPVPPHKVFGRPNTGLGVPRTIYGLPRFPDAAFTGRFPFATVALRDDRLPLDVDLTAWSPFEAGDPDNASLPFAALEYTLTNRRATPLSAVFSFHVADFLKTAASPARVDRADGGFALVNPGSAQAPADAVTLTVATDAADAVGDCAWFRGGWFDALSTVWRDVREARVRSRDPLREGDPSPGGSLYVPVTLAAGEARTITVRLSWYAPRSTVRRGQPLDETPPAADAPEAFYRPWYAGRFADATAAARHWTQAFADLRARSSRFADCLHDSTLPAEVTEAVTANLSILKSPTVLRQIDGRFWAWEGCDDKQGSCYGTCTHVWNYAQALPHLFPSLERSIRESEHTEALDARGHQEFRTPIPIRPALHVMLSAADGQLGGIIKTYRDWRISGDTTWLRRLWPALRRSLDYAISHWDPDREGWLVEPQHNTYDIEFWGPNGMLTSVYLAALQAAVVMGEALDEDVAPYRELIARGRPRLENELFNGQWFEQHLRWRGLRAGHPADLWSIDGKYSREGLELLEIEGPKYQYGPGVLSDGIIGAWFAAVAGLDDIVDPAKARAHLRSVFTHNFRADLSLHANPQRPGYALGDEAGLLLCTWPNGGEPSLPFVYSNEVWTGIEYQVASHLIMLGEVESGLTLVRATRARYRGDNRNPYDEYECGHWYARALASYALLQALTGARYDAVSGHLHLAPRIAGDFRSFFAWDGGYGTIGVREGAPFLDVVHGTPPDFTFRYTPFAAAASV